MLNCSKLIKTEFTKNVEQIYINASNATCLNIATKGRTICALPPSVHCKHTSNTKPLRNSESVNQRERWRCFDGSLSKCPCLLSRFLECQRTLSSQWHCSASNNFPWAKACRHGITQYGTAAHRWTRRHQNAALTPNRKSQIKSKILKKCIKK